MIIILFEAFSKRFFSYSAKCWGIVLFILLCFSTHIVNWLEVYTCCRFIDFVFLFSRAWGIFENFFF
jgi:hypothetical protein